MKIKKGDKVIVTTGTSRGTIGAVVTAFPKEERVLVEGANLKVSWKKDPNGESVQVREPRSIHISNVAIVDPKTGKATRVGIDRTSGKRVRVTKKSGSKLEK
jgi:large subunit ribosomal protein L24